MKILAIFLMLIAFIAGGFVALELFNSKPDELTQAEKEKAYTQILGRKANLNPKRVTGSTSYDGKLASFSYPAMAKIYDYQSSSIANNKNILEHFSFDLDSPRLILNFTVEENAQASSNLNDNSAVIFRKSPAGGYTEAEVVMDEVKGFSYEKAASGEFKAEKSAFVINGDKTYIISITGSDLKSINELFSEIAGTFVFK